MLVPWTLSGPLWVPRVEWTSLLPRVISGRLWVPRVVGGQLLGAPDGPWTFGTWDFLVLDGAVSRRAYFHNDNN